MKLSARLRALERDRAEREICPRCGSGTWLTIRLVVNGKEVPSRGPRRCPACGRDLRPKPDARGAGFRTTPERLHRRNGKGGRPWT